MINFFKNLFAYIKKNDTLFIILLINFVAMIKSKPQNMDLFQLIIFSYTYLFSAAFISWVHFTKGYFYEMGIIYAIKKKALENINKKIKNKTSIMKFLNTIYGSWVKVFLSAVLTMYLAELTQGHDLFSLDILMVKKLITAGVVALLPVILNFLNPNDPRYGNNK